MSHGKNVCKVLKEIRRKVADDNEIPLEIRECTFEGDCKGTCPYCEAEVRYLERELQKRQALGKAVTVASIALSSVMLPGCQPTQGDPIPPDEQPSTEKVAPAVDLVPIESEEGVQPPSQSKSTVVYPTYIDCVVGGLEVEEYDPTIDSALLNEEIPLIDEIPSDLP